MKTTGSYQFENLESREIEAEFLAQRAQLRLADFIPLLHRSGFPKQGKALEVGCGHGIRTQLIAENFPEIEVIGLDRSQELLNSKKRSENLPANLKFVEGNIYQLPYPPETFDFIYARLVFMHLNDPLKAIANIKKVLKPGGVLLIEDADRDCMFFEPAPKSFPLFWQRVQESQSRLGGDPNVGRKLAYYLKNENFKQVTTEVQNIMGAGPEIEFLVKTLLPSLNLYLETKDRPQGEQAIHDLALLAKNPNACFYHFWFITKGVK